MAKKKPLSERLAGKYVVAENGCWIWTAARFPAGYGMIQMDGKPAYAHRVMYELLRGPIQHETLDHLCRNRPCINPWHLEPCSMVENIMRGNAVPALNARKSHCLRGHELSGDNLRIRADGYRECKFCKRATTRECARRRTGYYQNHPPSGR